MKFPWSWMGMSYRDVSMWSVCHAVKEQIGSTSLIVSNSTVLLMSNEGRMRI